jgi:hypothetical protein
MHKAGPLYPEVVANHYAYRGCVDDHHNKRQDGGSKQGLALESTSWSTFCWPIRVFAFILAITEVNTYLAWVYFKDEKLENSWPFASCWLRLSSITGMSQVMDL